MIEAGMTMVGACSGDGILLWNRWRSWLCYRYFSPEKRAASRCLAGLAWSFAPFLMRKCAEIEPRLVLRKGCTARKLGYVELPYRSPKCTPLYAPDLASRQACLTF